MILIFSKSFTQNTIQKVESDLEENEQEQAELDSEEKASENESKGGVSDDNSEGEDNKDQDSSAQVDIKPETLVLSGTKGLYAKVSSFLGKKLVLVRFKILSKNMKILKMTL